ncbi:hypothetical protein BGZ91_012044 [Linnemannia elongata]|nr:hypothetical protein BGZ91_012044 [Linnemannia elongata]
MKCKDPTNGELGRVRTIDLYLSRLVEPKVVNDLLARFPSDLISSSESPSALPSPLTYHHHHLHNSRTCGEGRGREVSCSPSTDCSPKMSPLGLLSPSLSEDTVWLSSSGGGTPDHFSQPYHQHPQQQVLTDATTDLLKQQQQQQQRLSNDAHDGDSKNRHDGLGRTVDDDRFLGSNNCNSTNSISNDASASIMALLLMTHPKPPLPSPAVENYQLPHFTPCQQQLYQQQQQQSLQFFAQHSMCPQSNHPLGQDGACNALIQGIATCRGRVTNSPLYQHRMSESDSGDLLAYGGGGLLSHGAEAQLAEQQQVYQGTRGKNQQGRRHSLQPQQQQNRQHYQHQQQQQRYQQGGGNGNSGQRRKDQRLFSTSYQQKNSHYNHQHYYQQPLMSTSQDQHNVANSLSVTAQQASISLVSQPTAVSEAPLLKAPVSSRRRCISSGNFDPEPIAPIMPPSICSALRRRHARRMSCDGRLESYLTSLLESRSSQTASESTVAATVKVSVSSQSNSHRLQQQQQCSNQYQSQGVVGGHVQQHRGRSRTQGPSMLMEQADAHYRSKRHSLTISTDFPKDSLWDTSMSSVSDAGYDRRSSIASSISDISISLSHSTTFSSSSSTTSLSSSSSNGVCTRKGGPPVHYTLMCWIGGRWPCRLRPLIKKSTLNDIHIMLRRNLKLPPNYYIDIEFEWQGQTYMIMDATHWQWAREQVQDGDMAIRCKIWQKRFAR